MRIFQFFEDGPLWDVADKVGIAAALLAMVASLVFSFLSWRDHWNKERRDHDLIYIRLQVAETGMLVTVNGKIRRKNLTRAEVLGLLGMLPMREGGKPRYDLSGLSHPVFFDELEAAQVDGAVYEVLIPCTYAEFEQFDPVLIRKICTIETGITE